MRRSGRGGESVSELRRFDSRSSNLQDSREKRDRARDVYQESDMSKELPRLLEAAKRYQMTAEEREEQVCSFAYGNVHLENAAITKEDIWEAMMLLKRKGSL